MKLRTFLSCALLAACSHSHPAPEQAKPAPPPVQPRPPTADEAYLSVAQHFLADYLKLAPVDATQFGEHAYDGTWPDVSVAGDTAFHQFLQTTHEHLAAIPIDQLAPQNKVDAQILEDQLKLALYSLDSLKPHEVEPMYYTDLIGTGLDPLINRAFGTESARKADLAKRLDGIPAIVAVAQQRLQHPSKINTETAIQQNAGLVALVDGDLAKDAAVAPSAKKASAALHAFGDFLQKDLLPRSDGSFRLGRERFAKKLALVLEDDVDIDQLAAAARATIAETQVAMVATAKEIWTADKQGPLPKLATPAQQKAFVKKVLDHVAADHPTNASILADSKQWLAKATAFVKEKDLVRVPDEPVSVIEMPEYRRGVAVAYCDSSGPLEAKPETSFAISPAPADWPAARVASFYREYNQGMLADLAVHEAMPGHYLQLMHNNRFASKLRAVFGNGAFVEGWAVYGEWLMAEHGFGGPRVKLQRQKMVLRTAMNAILDHDIQAGDLDEKAAIAMMKDEAFQEDGEAVGKWKRARLTSAQLSTYFYGFSELSKLRVAHQGDAGFSERAYHDKLLSFGSPAIRYIRELMK